MTAATVRALHARARLVRQFDRARVRAALPALVYLHRRRRAVNDAEQRRMIRLATGLGLAALALAGALLWGA